MATVLSTIAGSDTNVSDEALEELRTATRGYVLTPGDEAYERVRAPYNAMQTDQPGLIVQCSGTADVVDAVNFARSNGLEVAVRGGGHSVAGLSSSNGGMLIDLSLMNGVFVDADARLARVQGGALWGDVDRETQLHGLAAPGGIVSDTGVAGLTLGGGEGWLRRKYGLSCDNLVAAEVVGADGQVRIASTDSNPDLFWALRGGGGNFGIVTSFTFQLHPLGPIVAFAGIFYPLADAVTILRKFRDFGNSAPDEVSAIAIGVTMPADPSLPPAVHDQHCLVIGGLYAGGADEGMEALQPLREFGTSLADISQPMPYTAVQSAFDGFFPRQQWQSYWKSTFLKELSDDAIDLIAEKARERPSPLSMMVTFLWGGAINKVGSEDTAFTERSAPWMASVDGNWPDPSENDDNVGWVRDAWSAISKFGTGSVYLNFTGISDEETDVGVDSAHGKNLRRLSEIKAKYDPDNFFRLNNNITPAGS
ncbi:MAG TPA: FAD-binding oxidoreductase [Gaiellaceae bacterium]|nr:FAD-binding oxidoreductase [Gaiellaceae bacterium]